MRRFDGKVVVVTGSGFELGLGQAILQRFADEGATCVVSDIGRTGDLERIANELGSRCAKAIAIDCDVTSDTEVAGLIDATVAEFGRIDVLVNTAGAEDSPKPFLETSLAEWQAVVAVNLTGTFLLTKHAARAMIALGEGGRIVNIVGDETRSGLAAHSSASRGIIGLMQSNAAEFRGHGITVNTIRQVSAANADTAAACAWLASDDAKNVTGEVVSVSA